MSDFESSSRPGAGTAAETAQTAQDAAREGTDLVADKAGDVAGTVREQAAEVTGEATARAQDVIGELRSQLEDQARSQTQRLADNIRRLADDLHGMSRNGDSDSSAVGAVKQIADRGHQAASRLEDRGPDGLLGDLQGFGRRRPGAFLAGAALAGFATARLAKGAKAADGAEDPPAGTTDGGAGWRASQAPAPRPTPPSPPLTASSQGDMAPGPVTRSDPYPDARQS
ncbi:hypothetical protein GA0115261_1034710 [Streptomyces sp. OspMP-M43]|nr:hypothetical protein GA0115261_1034710 [Streptomyces sp. OspMP-M43]